MMAKYSFSEVRKTWAAVAGLVATVIATILADSTLRGLLPPNVVALLGAAATVMAVFKVPNAPSAPTAADAGDLVARADVAVQAAKDHAAAAEQGLRDIAAKISGTSLAQQVIEKSAGVFNLHAADMDEALRALRERDANQASKLR